MAETRIGELRWLVWQIVRQQTADPNGTGIIEVATNSRQVHAKIEALRPVTFYGARQVDFPITHNLTIRWSDYLDDTHAFIRETRRAVDGAIRTEVFRVRRVMEEAGRKRFMRCEVELEDAGWTAPVAQIGPVVLDPNGNPVNVAELDPL